MRWIVLLFWLALCYGVAWISSAWTTAEITGWYRALVRPWFAPPNWVFAPVWTALYALMAIAAWLVSQTVPSPMRTWGLTLFLVQLALNAAWSWIFFHQHAMGMACIEVSALWAAIGATILIFARISPLAAWLLVPYWAWVSFAAVLNWAFWRLN